MHNHIFPAHGLSGLSEAVLFEWAQADCQACLNHLTLAQYASTVRCTTNAWSCMWCGDRPWAIIVDH